MQAMAIPLNTGADGGATILTVTAEEVDSHTLPTQTAEYTVTAAVGDTVLGFVELLFFHFTVVLDAQMAVRYFPRFQLSKELKQKV
jgi:hypothetical protein